MKKSLLTLFAGFLLLSLTCGGKSEVEITINLTNPQDLAIPYDGYYKLEATGDSVAMTGNTPGEYTFMLEKGESASGIVFKDTIDMVDTLYFQLLADGEEKLSQKVTTIIEIIQFQITAQ